MASTSKSTARGSGTPPPSTQEPAGTGSSSSYAIGAALLAVLIAGLLYWKCSSSDEPAPTPPPAPAPKAQESAPLPEFAPPPPPEESAEPDAGAKPTGKVASGGGGCADCGKGVSNGKLEGAVASTAGLARGCYQRALRTGGAEGKLNVRLSIGSDGSVCNAAVTNDSLGNAMVTQCVVGKFRSRTFPKPDQGCVVVNVPFNFEMTK